MTESQKSRRRGRGALYRYKTKAGERWRWQLYTPTDPEEPTTEIKRISGAGYTTMKAAEAAMRDKLAELAANGYVTTDRFPTVAQYANTWLAGFRGAESTIAGYSKLIRLHITPNIGTVRIDRLRATKLAQLYRTLEASGRKDHGHEGEGLSVSTVHKVHVLIGAILDSALNEGLVTKNVARLKAANPPRMKDVREARAEIHPWTAEELNTFIQWSEKHASDLHTAWVVAARTGLRRGELLALRWSDFDPTKRTLAVRRAIALIRMNGTEKIITKLPKNSKTRVLDLDDTTVSALKTWKAESGSIALNRVTGSSLIFGRIDDNTERHPERTSRRFRSEVIQARKALGDDALPQLSLHGLRHTHATLLLEAGVQPKVVQERLGHQTIAITMDLYSHVMPTLQREAVDAFAQLLG